MIKLSFYRLFHIIFPILSHSSRFQLYGKLQRTHVAPTCKIVSIWGSICSSKRGCIARIRPIKPRGITNFLQIQNSVTRKKLKHPAALLPLIRDITRPSPSSARNHRRRAAIKLASVDRAHQTLFLFVSQ